MPVVNAKHRLTGHQPTGSYGSSESRGEERGAGVVTPAQTCVVLAAAVSLQAPRLPLPQPPCWFTLPTGPALVSGPRGAFGALMERLPVD